MDYVKITSAVLFILFSIWSSVQCGAVSSPISPPSMAPAPSPEPAWVNVTDVLVEAGQFTRYVSMITSTSAFTDIQSRANDTHQGVTVFAPTDAAFKGLRKEYKKALAKMTTDAMRSLAECHAVPNYIALGSFTNFTSMPMQTMGGCSLNVSAFGAQVNVSTELMSSPISSSVLSRFPVAVYQVDRLLLPEKMFGRPLPPVPSPAPLPDSPSVSPAASDSPDNVGSSPVGSTDASSANSLAFVGPTFTWFLGSSFAFLALALW